MFLTAFVLKIYFKITRDLYIKFILSHNTSLLLYCQDRTNMARNRSGPLLLSFDPTLSPEQEAKLTSNKIFLSMEAVEGVLIDSLMIHRSDPNKTGKV